MTTLSTTRKLSEPWLLISDYEKVAEHALAMLKAVYLREGPDAAVSSAKYMVEAAAIVIANELGPAETRRFLHFVGVRRGQEH